MICNQRQISHLNILTLENMDFAFVSLAVCISPAWPGSDDLRIQSVRIEIAINTTLPIFLQIIINYSNPGCSIPSPGPPACWLGAGWAATSDPAPLAIVARSTLFVTLYSILEVIFLVIFFSSHFSGRVAGAGWATATGPGGSREIN